MNRICVYGFGNPGRQDDGLGPAMARMVEAENIEGLITECNYQLNIEDAELLSRVDFVVFVDASLSGGEPFCFEKIEAAHEISFTSHAVSPASVVSLCEELFGKRVMAWILGIRGYAWEFEEGLTKEAQENLEKAFSFLLGRLALMSGTGTALIN